MLLLLDRGTYNNSSRPSGRVGGRHKRASNRWIGGNTSPVQFSPSQNRVNSRSVVVARPNEQERKL